MNKISLDKDIYSQKSIIKAIKDFNNICNISLLENENYFICCFEKCDYNVDKTIHEFCNYLIDL